MTPLVCTLSVRNAPSTAGDSMTDSERPSPEPLPKKEASPAVLAGREFWKCSGAFNALTYRALGDPSRALERNSRKSSESVSRVFPEFVPESPMALFFLDLFSSSFRKNPHAHKSFFGTSTPPSKKPNPPPKRRNFMGMGVFQQKRTPKLPAAHKIGTAISGPRIAGGNMSDVRFLSEVLLCLVAQCSATPASVAATPPCSATPFQRQLDVRHSLQFKGDRCDRAF